VDGGWTEWEEWQDMEECTVLCGGGTQDQERARSCTQPAPAYGGSDCDGENYQNRNITCQEQECGGESLPCVEGPAVVYWKLLPQNDSSMMLSAMVRVAFYNAF